MTDSTWVALISLAGTLIGSLSGILVSNRLVNYRLEQLEKRVALHNNVIERTYRLEERMAVMEAAGKKERNGGCG